MKRMRVDPSGKETISIIDSHLYRDVAERNRYVAGFTYRFSPDNIRTFVSVIPDDPPEDPADETPYRKPFNYSSKTHKT